MERAAHKGRRYTGFIGPRRVNHWLLKTDPETYSFTDLVRERRTTWDGVTNNQALLFIRQMKKGDLALIYHSGGDKYVAGLADVVRGPYPDPRAADEKLVVVELRAGQALPVPVPLSVIKADPAFADFHLVRISRLSVMPVPPDLWARLLSMGGL